ncbi:MAG TPA: M1 family metallopeptidase [Gemmatimonadales bacterium]|jgi:aminopeptidase N
MRLATLLAAVTLHAGLLAAQGPLTFTHADTLRGSNTPGRSWWDATFYDLHVRVDPADSTISGWNVITYRVVTPRALARDMQIDLQMPLVIDSVIEGAKHLAVRRDSNAFFVNAGATLKSGESGTVAVYYHGRPRVATNPPWGGGFQWTVDSLGNRWFNTTNEGLGASVWWPNKDYLADEPDSQRIAITVPDPTFNVSNGRLRKMTHHDDKTTTYEWFVADPINNYDVAVNAGAYAHFSTIFNGARGPLTMDFWPLAYHADTARVQFKQAEHMMACFENWFGPYPWYDDGYKLVETAHLGMEHQSGVAYGNKYKNSYLGRDLSGTGIGLKWDYIIVHESAHEWWGNSVTVKDVADMWVHEGFAYYAEGLYTECTQSKEAGAKYLIGSRRGIRNVTPVIGIYGVNHDGSGDMYPKGANLLHTIRQLVNDDTKWKDLLRGLQHTFWHQTVTSAQVEQYIARQAGLDLTKVFDQYLRGITIPTFEYTLADSTLRYRWSNVVPGFAMPVRVTTADSTWSLLTPTETWTKAKVRLSGPAAFHVDENFYVMVKGPNDSVPVLSGR